ncbi:MAG: hypothetical protein V1899_09750 [Planctomycetota bacterium]
MDRKRWLMLVYREANLFIERNTPPDRALTKIEADDLEPELSRQLQEVLISVEYPEDLIKHSLLKNPSSELWHDENNWQHVLLAVALSCLLHDVFGVVRKILEGTMPQTPAEQWLDPL